MRDRILTCREVRRVDELATAEFHLPGIALMENAGRGVADLLEQLGISGPVLIAAGAGNNGGDGFVAARHLEARGREVAVLLLAPPEKLKGDARINYDVLRAARTPLVEVPQPAAARRELAARLADAEWVLDAMLGTGSAGDPRPPFDAAVELANGASVKRLAVDLPTGLDADSGIPGRPAFRADHTATFVAVKPGFLQPAAQRFVGQIHVLDIGIPRRLWTLLETE